jgi:hypothetical protein
MPYPLKPEQHNTLSNTAGLTPGSPILGVHKDNVKVDIGLRIIRVDAKAIDFTAFGPLVRNSDLNLNGKSHRPKEEVFARVETCRQEWKKAVVDCQNVAEEGRPKYQFPFQDEWDFADQPQLLKGAAPKLAVAGSKLFSAIFELKADAGLKEVGKALRDVLSGQPRCISITSSDVFLPWGMLYTHPVAKGTLDPNGSNWEKEGFWGYQHIVQQNPDRLTSNNVICLDAGASILSVNFDNRLSDTLKLPIIDTHIEFITALGGKNSIKCTKKAELAHRFSAERTTLERILYFYCHGNGSSDSAGTNLRPPHLVFSDDVITAMDFEDWANEQDLSTHPLLFINACQGGQMQTMFYESFAVELLKQGAAGLVGAQIDIPAVFACAYGQRVLSQFFRKDGGQVRLGPLLRDVNREMWDKHSNPLGLAYSLYRGVDCFINWPTGRE